MAKKAKPVKGPKCCECESTKMRREFREAKSCGAKTRAFERLKQAAAADYEHLKPPARRLLYRELLQKAQTVQNVCGAEEAADTARFNGLGRMRGRRRARAAHW